MRNTLSKDEREFKAWLFKKLLMALAFGMGVAFILVLMGMIAYYGQKYNW
jgi:hypothetical protein